ncbi:MAG: SusC/RagA family TonB-linked outer membrane protein [Tannerella sp.]|jgi:TonB-linked SusC/RagA family outer membrane protein|nr:SusC/RagA family TonB-linked outer membrane protein [Tannerella sp.]
MRLILTERNSQAGLRKILRKMKLALFFSVMVISCWATTESTYAQETEISLTKGNKTLLELFTEIEDKSEFIFFYNDNAVDLNRKVRVDGRKYTIQEILNQVLKGSAVNYEIIDRQVIFYRAKTTAQVENAAIHQQAAKKPIRGKVSDINGEPIIGANVVVKGTTDGNISDVNGDFVLEVDEGAVLRISYIGYITQEIATGNRTNLQITLLEDRQALEEVVVTALGIKREEKALGYSVQTVKGDALTAVKGVEIATSLTGRIAGLTVYNSAEFQDDSHANTLMLRGEGALLVVDGFPVSNTGLRDIAADDIETITVLKGSTASALYGSRGSSGAIMVTTKRGAQQEGVNVSVNSNEMFNAGFLAIPEHQTSYSAGQGGIYNVDDYVWGDKLDIGRTAPQYDPYTYEVYDQPLVSKGKNNFRNFMEPSFTTNNNVSVTYTGKQGSFRTSMNHIHQKGYYPNTTANRFNLNVAGNLNIGKFALDASVNYTKRVVPQTLNNGWSQSSPIYSMIVWMGADWDIMEYKDYWQKGQEGVKQNFSNSYYNNPWFIQNEWTISRDEGRYNAQVNSSYDITDWLKATARIGSDQYSLNDEEKKPQAYKKRADITGGDYRISNSNGYSVNLEGMLMADKTIADFRIDGFVGASLYYNHYTSLKARVADSGQLSVPEFYSLLASNGPVLAESGAWQQQRNAAFGKVGLSWKSALFLDVTGRNDWTSTLDASERSYFYPSVAGSAVLTEFLPKIDWLSFWKLRGSWTQTKLPTGIYEINQSYSINTNVWNNIKGASYSTDIRPGGLKPRTTEGWEVGTAVNFLDNRLRFDLAYFQKLYYNNQSYAALSDASGFGRALVNTDEEFIRKGLEITLSGDVVRTKDFLWTSTVNWSNAHYSYHKLDETYSSKDYRVAVGNPANTSWRDDWMYHPETGELILQNGMPVASNYNTVFNKEPDWTWGFLNDFRYKNINLLVSFDGRVGGMGFNEVSDRMWGNGTHPDSDNAYRYEEVVNGNRTFIAPGVKVISGEVKFDASGRIESDTRVFAPNDVVVGYEQYIRSYQGRKAVTMQDMTFFKLREISLGYTLPKAISGKLKLSLLQVSFVAQNVFLWAKEFKYEDPDAFYDNLESVLPSPSERLVGFNVKVEF